MQLPISTLTNLQDSNDLVSKILSTYDTIIKSSAPTGQILFNRKPKSTSTRPFRTQATEMQCLIYTEYDWGEWLEASLNKVNTWSSKWIVCTKRRKKENQTLTFVKEKKGT